MIPSVGMETIDTKPSAAVDAIISGSVAANIAILIERYRARVPSASIAASLITCPMAFAQPPAVGCEKSTCHGICGIAPLGLPFARTRLRYRLRFI